MKKIALMLAGVAGVLAAAPAMAQSANFGFTGTFGISSGLGNMTTPVTLSGTTTAADAADGSFTLANFQLMSALGNYDLGTGTVVTNGSTLNLYEGANTLLGTFALSNLMTSSTGYTATGTLTAGNQGFTLPDGNFIGIQSGSGTFSLAAAAGAVPEAATWAMMILGMGAVGFAMRRQKVTTRVSYAG